MKKIKKKVTFGILVLIILAVVGFWLNAGYDTAEIREHLHAGEKAVRYKQFESNEIPGVFLIKGDLTKVVQKVVTKGFVDQIAILVTMSLESGMVLGVEILEHQETEDYGGYVTADWFLNRFQGKESGQTLTLVKMFNQTADEVVAITGATKTSAAVLAGVNLALANFSIIKGGI